MIVNDGGKGWSKLIKQEKQITRLKEVQEDALHSCHIEFDYKGNNYTATGGQGANYWIFCKNEERLGSVYGFENVFTYKFIDGKSILDVFDEIEPDIEFD